LQVGIGRDYDPRRGRLADAYDGGAADLYRREALGLALHGLDVAVSGEAERAGSADGRDGQEEQLVHVILLDTSKPYILRSRTSRATAGSNTDRTSRPETPRRLILL